MPGKVFILDLINRRAAGTLERGEVALVSLLDMADVTLEDFRVTDRHERLIRELENSGNVISDEVFEYWSQNTDLEVQLEVLPVEDGAPAPMNQGPILQIRVRNQRHKVSVPFDDRSPRVRLVLQLPGLLQTSWKRPRTTTSSCSSTSLGCPCTGAPKRTCCR